MTDIPKRRFVSEDQTKTFEGWLEYQAFTDLTAENLESWRKFYDGMMQNIADRGKVGLMKLGQLPPGEHRYAVAVRYDDGLFLALWVRRARQGDCYVMIPRDRESGDPHASYHRKGDYHHKSFNHKVMVQKRQPLNASFRGIEGLGTFAGYGPKSVGAVCNPDHFSAVLELPQQVLGPSNGHVTVDLVEPGVELDPRRYTGDIVARKIYTDGAPWLAVTVAAT
jgi:hypothetical protein